VRPGCQLAQPFKVGEGEDGGDAAGTAPVPEPTEDREVECGGVYGDKGVGEVDELGRDDLRGGSTEHAQRGEETHRRLLGPKELVDWRAVPEVEVDDVRSLDLATQRLGVGSPHHAQPGA
jgi:hypothetical protein